LSPKSHIMTDLRNATIGELVAEDYRRAEVFKKFGLDFCCGGGRSVTDSCKKHHLDETALIKALEEIEKESTSPEQDYNKWNADVLVEHIIKVHHTYVESNIPLIREFSQKVAKVHGGANPEEIEIAELFDALSLDLLMHMKKEEMILFPYIKLLANDNGLHQQPPFGTVANPIRMMENEHEIAGDLMKEIRKLSNDYTPPAHACNTYRVLYAKLDEFESDLHQHIHLENNILFPKALQLEQKNLS